MSTGMKLGSLIDEETATVGSERQAKAEGGGIRAALNSGGAKAIVGVVLVLVIAFAAVRTLSVARSTAPIRGDVRYMHLDTGEMRWFKVGQKAPEGFHPVEYCFENSCGPDGGTPVILNAYLGDTTKTTCPKCGADVVGHNPRPEEYADTIPKDQQN